MLLQISFTVIRTRGARMVTNTAKLILTIAALFSGAGVVVAGQATTAAGSIAGIVSDPSGGAIPRAAVTITGQSTGQVLRVPVSSSGVYNSGTLIPGSYKLRVEAEGFRTAEMDVTVLVGVTAPGNVRLELGSPVEVIEVRASAAGVDAEHARVQGVVGAAQIDMLPIDGRSFLALAQLEPGIQIQDGTNFDPTKVGYISVSFGGRFGRTSRITLDGIDISDEVVGTATQNIPLSALQQFQISQSNLDLSTDPTSAGAVNGVTRSGDNNYHGDLFYMLRDHRFGAALPHPEGLSAPYQRQQFGGRAGGPILRDKLFFFIDYERTKHDAFLPVQYAAPFQAFSGGFSAPFRENMPLARLDWQPAKDVRLFFRFNYFSNATVASYFSASLQPYRNKNYARTYAGGGDFVAGKFTHSIRFGNLKFENGIVDAVTGTNLPLANLGVTLSVVNGPQTGPNLLAPQATLQQNRQIKYDGGRVAGRHVIRYGMNYNHVQVAVYASFFGLAPQVTTNLSPDDIVAAANGPFLGGPSNPLNYPVDTVWVANGQGYFSDRAALGFPTGGFPTNHRLAFYIGDTWRVRTDLTLTYGLRYVRDTGRTNADFPAVPELDALIPGAGARTTQPNKNFAPQIGIAWNPGGRGKTVVRAGAGLFFESMILIGDRYVRLPRGAFNQGALACNFGEALPVSVPGGTIAIPDSLCNQTVGQAAAGIAAFQAQYQATMKSDLNAPNLGYVLSKLADGVNLPWLLNPAYRTPRSLQLNIGIEREIARGTVLTADYVRNVTTHTLLVVDVNHTGDARYFNLAAAREAISATLSDCGAGSVADGIARPCPSGNMVDLDGARRPLRMTDFASRGLTSPGLDFGGVCNTGYGCAFPGVNSRAPAIPMMSSIGRSVYNGLHVKFRQDVNAPSRALRRVNLQAAYSLSRLVNAGGANPTTPGASDQDFVVLSADNRDPLAFTGPSLLDRTHQFSFGGVFDLPFSLRASLISHFYSGLPLTLVVPNTGEGAGEIFRTDFSGDGTVQDILPGTKIGSVNRSVPVPDLTQLLQNYNQKIANQPTPAGQVLIDRQLFTLDQLRALGGVTPAVSLPPPGQAGIGSMRSCDVNLSWVRRFGERLTVQPNVGFYNVFNFANFDLPPNVLSGLLTGSPGTINGTTQSQRITNRVGAGTGVFALGAPRAIEFGLRISF